MKKIYIFSNQIQIEAEDEEEALEEFKERIEISVLPDFLKPENWDVIEVDARDLDQYIDLP